ncbi:ECF transporter S component [Alistipes sp. AF48-12]|uniref:ECF transporter S component n=1 Tax=Alistipes sp. AF48-12 TaxID=2291998 RepID=UPI000E545835|nr:ECF transporter S component [Alistipes sp. AF48-12]RHO71761.1 ECF transporter S component [Alistipes sp. AF48-12]
METTVKLYSLNFRQAKTYWFTLLFVAGNLILPQLCHLIPQGGLILLPIYFFTLIAAYKFGIRVGLLTAVLSPLANSALFEMPAAAVLPEILIKSVTLAVAAAMAARYLKNVSLLAMVAVVLTYQIIGSLFEWALTGSFLTAMQDFRLGVPGMLLQIVAGYALLKWLAKR